MLRGSLLALGLLGCGAEGVAARAVWVDGLAADGVRRIHVYDQGDRYAFEVLGDNDPQERVWLGPRGRGLLVRAGSTSGAWFDLDDGRRLPLLLPPSTPGGDGPVSFADRGDALWWLDPIDTSLRVVPLAPGVSLRRRDDGSMIPIAEPGSVTWALGSLDAPVLLVKHDDGRASFFRYPDATDPQYRSALVREATIEGLPLPRELGEHRSCLSAIDCFTLVGLDASGELAITANDEPFAEWSILDVRAPQLAGTLELPERLSNAAVSGGLGLLGVLDRSVSVWIGAGHLYRWDRAAGIVGSTPVFAKPPLFWFPVDRGRALVLLSMTGPMYRIDAEHLSVLNLESTDCALIPGSAPIVSPRGEWASWACSDGTDVPVTTSGVIVRASVDGLERHVGVPMVPLAIDDDGDLLLYSVASTSTDEVDGVALTSRPHSLFVLSNQSVLTRIDELEPAPAPVLLGAGDLATHMQGAALD